MRTSGHVRPKAFSESTYGLLMKGYRGHTSDLHTTFLELQPVSLSDCDEKVEKLFKEALEKKPDAGQAPSQNLRVMSLAPTCKAHVRTDGIPRVALAPHPASQSNAEGGFCHPTAKNDSFLNPEPLHHGTTRHNVKKRFYDRA